MLNGIEEMFKDFQLLKPDLLSALEKTPNESDTRLKVLDRILLEVLKWRHESILTEPPSPSGFIDYLLTVGEGRGAIVIEAKRSGLFSSITTSSTVTVDDHPKLSHWGCGYFLGLIYVVKPRRSRYSIGLR